MAYLHQVQNTKHMPYMLADNKSLHQATGYVPIWPPLHSDQKVFQQLQMMLFVRVNRALFTGAMLRPIYIKTVQQAQGVFEEILWHLLGWISRYKLETDWETFKRQYVNFDVISNLVRAYGARLEADYDELWAVFHNLQTNNEWQVDKQHFDDDAATTIVPGEYINDDLFGNDIGFKLLLAVASKKYDKADPLKPEGNPVAWERFDGQLQLFSETLDDKDNVIIEGQLAVRNPGGYQMDTLMLEEE